MELKDFISATLVQIQEGVQDAINKRSAKSGSAGAINPVWGEIQGKHSQLVQFDVAITVSSKSSQLNKEALKIASIEKDEGNAQSSENNSITRIKFSVPIIPPVQSVISSDD